MPVIEVFDAVKDSAVPCADGVVQGGNGKVDLLAESGTVTL